jgi:hypothetical protein
MAWQKKGIRVGSDRMIDWTDELYRLRKMAGKSSKRFPNIVEEAQQEWLS